uniref:Uncharacterized protein n=1 Tax=Macrostomum lignano TaxID=282301 RepID=A0A1I8IQF9_9PLAT
MEQQPHPISPKIDQYGLRPTSRPSPGRRSNQPAEGVARKRRVSQYFAPLPAASYHVTIAGRQAATVQRCTAPLATSTAHPRGTARKQCCQVAERVGRGMQGKPLASQLLAAAPVMQLMAGPAFCWYRGMRRQFIEWAGAPVFRGAGRCAREFGWQLA